MKNNKIIIGDQKFGQFLKIAEAKLAQIGILNENYNNNDVNLLLEKIENIDKEKVTMIALILNKQGLFNQVVRDNISEMKIADRQNDIINGFNLIKKDAQREIDWVEQNQTGIIVYLTRLLTKLKRGSIGDQFNKIKKKYLEVVKDNGIQLKKEEIILDSYINYRLSMKEAQVLANDIYKIAEKEKNYVIELIKNINEQINKTDDKGEKLRLELKQSELQQSFRNKDQQYQIIKDFSENLVIAYNASEAVFARLNQISDVKKRVFEQSVSFFGTNEIVFTALSATLTSNSGLKESTETLNAMKNGIEDGIRQISKVGDKVLEDGVKAGYGKTIDVSVVKDLVKHINEYQQKSYDLIKTWRNEATQNAKEIEKVVQDGKNKFAEIVSNVENL